MASTLPLDCGPPCGPSNCDGAFTRVIVDFQLIGGTRVSWSLSAAVASEPGPHVYQLQVGTTANPLADDWKQVGSDAVDTWFMIDDTQRIWGVTQWLHYRVVLQTGAGLHYSDPVPATGWMSQQGYNRARNIFRRLVMNSKSGWIEGYLLKQKLVGEKCTCIDYQTEVPDIGGCDECYGTGFVGGFFPPMPCVRMSQPLVTRRDQIDGSQTRGTINDIQTEVMFLGTPQLYDGDVFVSRASDMRWWIHKVTERAVLEEYPLLVNAEIRRAAFTEQIYQFPIPGQKRS